MKFKVLALCIGGVLAFMALALTGVLLEQAGERDEMKACVESGKEWRHVGSQFNDRYECVAP